MSTFTEFGGFVIWAARCRQFPTAAQVMERFGVPFSTAHKWLNYYADAACINRPYINGRGRRRAA